MEDRSLEDMERNRKKKRKFSKINQLFRQKFEREGKNGKKKENFL